MGKGTSPTFGRHSFIGEDDWDNTWEDEVTIGSFTSISTGITFRGARSQHAITENREMVCTYDLPVVLPKILKWTNPETGDTGGVNWPIMGRGTGKIDIGSDVWMGSGVLLATSHSLSVGHGAIIGAGSVISRNIPPYAIAAGNPCTIKRYRYLSHIIESLLSIKWWEWSDEEIVERSPDMLNVNDFIEKYTVVLGIPPTHPVVVVPPTLPRVEKSE